MNKPIVQFSRKAGVVILPGYPAVEVAMLQPSDHPDSINVSNKNQLLHQVL